MLTMAGSPRTELWHGLWEWCVFLYRTLDEPGYDADAVEIPEICIAVLIPACLRMP